MKYLVCLLFAGFLSAHALETDNYLTWDKTLPDSADALNGLVRGQIEDVLSKSDDVSCETITFRIARRFKTTPGKKLIEN